MALLLDQHVLTGVLLASVGLRLSKMSSDHRMMRTVSGRTGWHLSSSSCYQFWSIIVPLLETVLFPTMDECCSWSCYKGGKWGSGREVVAVDDETG